MSNYNLPENPYFGILETNEDINYKKYDMSKFDDEIVESPWRFELVKSGTSKDGNDIVSLVPQFGELIQEGTPINQMFLGNMDVHLYYLYKFKEWALAQILALSLKGDASDGSILNGFIAVTFYATLKDIDPENIIILDGYYDEDRGELSV